MSFKAKALSTVAALTMTALPQISSAGQGCSVVVMNEILPYMVSSGTDNDVNAALFGMASDYYSAIGDGASDAGQSAGATKAGLLLQAAGAGSKGLSAVMNKLPAVIGAIDESRDDADDLYMSLSTERGHEAAFFPVFGDYTDRFSPGVSVGLEGVSGRVVPYIFGVDPNRDSISVTLFDHDSSSRDDIIGSFVFSKNDAGKGKLAALSISEKHGGVVYAVQYEVVPVTCEPVFDMVLKPMYQSVGFSTLEDAQVTTIMSLTQLGLLKDELARKNIQF